MTPATHRKIETRSVMGRAASPYRGATNDEPHAAREPAAPRGIDEIADALQAIPNITTSRTGHRFDLRRGPLEVLVIACRTQDTLALADLTFVGNEYLAILALDALVPLFGAIELAVGEYRDLVDDSEPGAAYARYEQFMREKAELQAAAAEKQRKAVDAARLAMADNLIGAGSAPPRTGLWAVLIMALVVAVIAGGWALSHFTKGKVGDSCTDDGQCRSGECTMRGGYYFNDRYDGVCTETCNDDSDCPRNTGCYGYAYGPSRCLPDSW